MIQSYLTQVAPKAGVKIACFNPDNEQLEYHTPINASLYDYDGEMYHFHNDKMDIKVTPNHKMWAQERRYEYNGKTSARKALWSEWKKVEAKDLKLADYNRFRAKVNWNGTNIEYVNVDGKEVPIELYLEYLGYLISEGCLYTNGKHLPSWIKELSPRLLTILLEALVKGDGTTHARKNSHLNGFSYYTTSKQLADDIYEIVYKCGFVPTIFSKPLPTDNHIVYTVMWSNSGKGEFPLVWKTSRNSQTKIKHNTITREKYHGKVWCFQVPTGLFITRRNGRITIQGNSVQFDKDAKIFTHPGISIERIGYGQGIYDISGDVTQLVKEMYVGLMVPPVLMDGGADTTYANGGVALDVLRQRYMQFRNMLALWLKRKVFAPIAEIQGFWEYKKGGAGRSSEKQLIIPEVDWNHMSLFDAGDYTSNLITLSQSTGEGAAPRVSKHTLYRSLGLEWEDEQRKLRIEAIQDAINNKEREALAAQTLIALRSISEDDEITVPEGEAVQQEAPVPGETEGMGSPGGGGAPDLGLPGLGGGPASTPAPSPPLPSGAPTSAPPPVAPPPPTK